MRKACNKKRVRACRVSGAQTTQTDKQTKKVCIPEVIGGGGRGGGDRRVLVLPGAMATGLGKSFIPHSLDSLERVLGKDEPREVLGESVLRILEL